MKKLDLDKPVRTRSGLKVEFLTISGRGDFPLVGYVGEGDGVDTWRIDGSYWSSGDGDEFDLVNVPERKEEVWFLCFGVSASINQCDAHTHKITFVIEDDKIIEIKPEAL